MSNEWPMPDILVRLHRVTPYGLEDFTVLKDAHAEIVRLRQLLEKRDSTDE